MSSMSLSAPVASSAQSSARSVAWGVYARIAIITTIVASLSNVVVYYFGDAIIGYNQDFVELGSAFGIVVMTASPALIAALLYAALLRYSDNPDRIFAIVSAAVFVVTLIPDITFIPGEPGASNAQTAVLIAMHVVAAAVIVRMLTAFERD
jgi:hypothetical protein